MASFTSALTDSPAVTIAVAVALAFAAAAAVVRIAHVVLRRQVAALEIVGAEDLASVERRMQQVVRWLMLLAYGVAAVASVSLALAQLGIGEPRWGMQRIAYALLSHGINIIVIIAGAAIVSRAASLALEHLQHKLARRHEAQDLEWKRRAATLRGILSNLVTVSVSFVAVLMLLRELTIDIMPILTGAGIAGLAIGFGAQNLVRDVISGFFLILEDQVRVGDLARINNVAGTVEQINLRTIVLRDPEGAVQVFPNGTITALANLSKQYAYAMVDVRVAYGEDMERVMNAIREVGAAMQRDERWGPLLLAPIEVPGIESLADGAATIRVKCQTQPFNQGAVANELRRRLMTTFVASGIKPYAT